ncbi:kinesin-like protein [Haematococcus lacustris]|uniref:Kinesin-like protein n=1 Tax=Haematococcus lacustris TaxID=44745 RepID=A0A699YUJ7_HAELA|nr:kinesin-like protein [Haematococcus lacustris]
MSACCSQLRGETRAGLEAAEKHAQDAAEALEAAKERFEHELRIKDLESEGQVAHFKNKWKAEWEKRKKLHNTVLELRGSIRVLCRVRPLLEKERAGLEEGAPDPVKVLSDEVMRVAGEKADKEFEFDRVFKPTEGQEQVFDEVSSLVTSVLDGYNVSIMAYGQTGSGKTYTMEGLETDPGVNSRALKELFRLAEERAEDLKYKFSASVLEIYNEQIYDLLAGGRDQDGDKLDVKQAPDGSMYVPGCKVEDVASLTDVAAVMRRGKQNRSTFATNMNEHSSRSHLVLSVQVTATAVAGGSTMRGKLHLIDLAGSERIGRTGAQGDRLKEAQNINKSLSALGDVIQALQQRHSHIPYRNSKLTRLLEDSLGSSSKCLMVVNVSPALENVAETKCSLEFASRARKVELGKARQHVESSATASLAPSPSILGAALGSSRPPVHTTSQSSRSNSGTTPEHSLRSSIAASTGSAQGRGKLGR